MLLIPQFYLRNGKAVRLEGTNNALFSEDPIAMANGLKASGVQAVYVMDLSIPAGGASPHLPLLTKIHDEIGLQTYVGGAFRSLQSIEPFLIAGLELVVLGTVAYQQPPLVKEACAKFPKKIATHIDVKGGRVTIPGWTVAANKTAGDYADRFHEDGVATLFYSDLDATGRIAPENLQSTLMFCKRVQMRIVLTSEISGLPDIEKFITLGAPRIDGLVLGKSFAHGLIDVGGATAFVGDLLLAAGNEPTISDE